MDTSSNLLAILSSIPKELEEAFNKWHEDPFYYINTIGKGDGAINVYNDYN